MIRGEYLERFSASIRSTIVGFKVHEVEVQDMECVCTLWSGVYVGCENT